MQQVVRHATSKVCKSVVPNKMEALFLCFFPAFLYIALPFKQINIFNAKISSRTTYGLDRSDR